MNARGIWRAECLKLHQSGVAALVIATALFVPGVVLLAQVRGAAPASLARPDAGLRQLTSVWEAMALLLLPLATVLLATLMAQIEVRAQGWKQLRAGPQPLWAVLVAKLALLLLLLAALLTVFTAAGGLGYGWALRWHGLAAGAGFPWAAAAERAAQAWLALLPTAVLQWALSLQWRGFAAPLGLGMGLWVLALGSLGWRWNFVLPHGYVAQLHLAALGQGHAGTWPLPPWQLGACLAPLVIVPAWLVLRWRPPQD